MTTGIAVVGYGYWGPNLARNFAALPGAELRCLCDLSEPKRELAKLRHPAAAVCENFADVLDDQNIEAVCIATPAATHFELALASVRSGRHTLVEKPLALSERDCTRLGEEADKHKVALLVDFPYPYTDAIRKLGKLCRAGEIGELLYFDSSRVNLGLFQSDVSVLWDLAPHDLSILAQITDMRPTAVSAVGIAHLRSHPVSTAYLTLFYDAPFIAHIQVSWLAPVKRRLTTVAGKKKMVVFDDTQPDEKIRVYDSGLHNYDIPSDAHNRPQVNYRRGDLWVPQLAQGEALAELARHFIAVTRGEEQAVTGASKGAEVARVLELAEQSLQREGARLRL